VRRGFNRVLIRLNETGSTGPKTVQPVSIRKSSPDQKTDLTKEKGELPKEKADQTKQKGPNALTQSEQSD
jgi:hypothetical protein